MSEEEKIGIESKITMINEFRQHLFRSLDVKTLISKDLITGVDILEKNLNDEEGLRLIKRAYKNETPFLDNLKKDLEKSKDFLLESYNWLKSVSNNSEFLSKIEELFKILNVFHSFFETSVKRFKAEKDFLSDPKSDSFQEFMFSWRDEIHNIKKLLKDINPQELDNYFKKVNLDNRSIMRLSFGSDKFNESINNKGIFFKDNDEFSLYFAYCLLLGSISLMIVTFYDLEKSIDAVNIETLKSLNV